MKTFSNARRPVGERPCRYAGCKDPLPAHTGLGRAPWYHLDARWPGGKNCKQMAADARKAVQDAGVGVLVDVMDVRAETLLEALSPFAEDLGELVEALEDLRGGLRSHVAAAEQARAGAEQARAAAEDRSRDMEREVQAARQQVNEVTRHGAAVAAEAKERVTAADRRVREAFDRVGALERKQGALARESQLAVERAEEEVVRRENAERETARVREDAERETARFRGELEALRRDGDMIRDQLADAQRQAAEQAARVVAAEGEVRGLRAAVERGAQQLHAAALEGQRLREQGEQLRVRILEAEDAAGQARWRAEGETVRLREMLDSAQRQVGAAERRYDVLVTALAISHE